MPVSTEALHHSQLNLIRPSEPISTEALHHNSYFQPCVIRAICKGSQLPDASRRVRSPCVSASVAGVPTPLQLLGMQLLLRLPRLGLLQAQLLQSSLPPLRLLTPQKTP